MLNWIYYPRTEKIPSFIRETVGVFEKYEGLFDSEIQLKRVDKNELDKQLDSNEVLKIVEPGLEELGYNVEKSKKKEDKIRVTVKYGNTGNEDLNFEADAYNSEHKVVIEVEAARALANNQFLKDIFQASMMIDTDYLILAVKNVYRNNKTAKTVTKDFEKINEFIETIYLTKKIDLDLKGILLIGY